MAGEVVVSSVQSYNASTRTRKSISFGGSANGTSTATGATSLTDGGASWTVDAFIGMTVYSNGKTGVVTTNSATVATVASWTGGTPASGNTYMIGTAATTFGYVGSQTVFTCNPGSGNGFYVVRLLVTEVNIAPTSAGGGTLALGVTGSTSLFIGASTATSMLGGWIDTTPNISSGKALPAALKDIFVANNPIVITTATADITAGQLIFNSFYDPISTGGMSLS